MTSVTICSGEGEGRKWTHRCMILTNSLYLSLPLCDESASWKILSRLVCRRSTSFSFSLPRTTELCTTENKRGTEHIRPYTH